MVYVDGFVAAVPTANKDAYRSHAAETATIFRMHGALRLTGCWGDDVLAGKEGDGLFPGRAGEGGRDGRLLVDLVAGRSHRDAGMPRSWTRCRRL